MLRCYGTTFLTDSNFKRLRYEVMQSVARMSRAPYSNVHATSRTACPDRRGLSGPNLAEDQ